MPAPGRNHLLLMPHGGYTYLLGPFRFATDAAAPLPSPYSEATAVGSLTVTDTGNRLSNSGGRMTTLAAAGTAVVRDGVGRVRSAGLAVFGTLGSGSAGEALLGWSSSSGGAGPDIHRFYRIASTTGWFGDATTYFAGTWTVAASTDYELAVILRGTGAFYFIRGGIYTVWTLVWVSATSTTTPLYAGYYANNAASNAAYDNLRVLDLAPIDSRFAADEGYATDRKASNSAGDAITQTADAWVEQTITAATGVDKDLYVRWVDDNNTWIVRQNQAGSTVKLIEKVAGVETSRMSVAQTFTNGTAYRLIAVCDGTTITVCVQPIGGTPVKAGAYASATTNQTATTAKAPVAGTEFKSYRRFTTFPAGI